MERNTSPQEGEEAPSLPVCLTQQGEANRLAFKGWKVQPCLGHSELLLVLDHPELPLHHNRSDTRRPPMRAQASCRLRPAHQGRRQSLGHHVDPGCHCPAARGVNFLHYLQDRLSGACALPASPTSSSNAPLTAASASPGMVTPYPRLCEKIRRRPIPRGCAESPGRSRACTREPACRSVVPVAVYQSCESGPAPPLRVAVALLRQLG